jgi:hypothetical protein
MSPVPSLFDFRGPRRVRTLALWAAFAATLVGLAFLALLPDKSSSRDDTADLVVLAAWGVLGLCYAWMRFRPRKAYDETARPRAEAFQGKRAMLLMLCAGYVGLMLTPMMAYEAEVRMAHASVVDRLFYAALFLGPCGLVLGLITTGIYSRQWGVLVDDELTLVHRARSLQMGFWMFVALGAAAYVTALFQPAWAMGAIPVVIGLSIAAAGFRFALLERAAAQADG